MKTTVVYESYWRFAAERLAMFYRRLADPLGPWTDDPILRAFRFTNTYRAADRVSQYLINEVQYRADRSQTPRELFFRTILFKIFNKIETWQALERAHGPLSWDTVDLIKVDQTLNQMHAKGRRIYSSAYIMPAPAFGKMRKHSNHLALLARMMADRLPDRLCQAPDLKTVYESILSYPGLGPFLAFQYAVDLNYSSMFDFDENDFIIAGPGALDGISKCFLSTEGRSAEAIIHWVTERQTEEFSKRGLVCANLFGRPLHLIDCQNLFCEISKYARAAHPDVRGVADRVRIKQTYRPLSAPLARPSFPPRWGLSVEDNAGMGPGRAIAQQFALL